MDKERPGIMIYFDVLPAVERLSKENAGILLQAMLRYGKYGTIPDFGDSEGLNIAWSFVKQAIDRDNERYAGRILRQTYGGYKREMQRRNEEPLPFEEWYQQIYLPSLEPGEEPPLPPPLPEVEPSGGGKRRGGGQRFVPPTVEEVRAYCVERRNGVDPEAFIDFYASKGWRVGNQSMKDWKACVRTWERRNGGQRGGGQNGGGVPFEYNPGDMTGSL